MLLSTGSWDYIVFIYLLNSLELGTMQIHKHFCKCANLAILANFQL